MDGWLRFLVNCGICLFHKVGYEVGFSSIPGKVNQEDYIPITHWYPFNSMYIDVLLYVYIYLYITYIIYIIYDILYIYRYAPESSKGCQYSSKRWWMDTLQPNHLSPFGRSESRYTHISHYVITTKTHNLHDYIGVTTYNPYNFRVKKNNAFFMGTWGSKGICNRSVN